MVIFQKTNTNSEEIGKIQIPGMNDFLEVANFWGHFKCYEKNDKTQVEER